MSGIQWDDSALRRLQEDANRQVQQVIRKVNEEMAGQPVNEVHAELMSRLRGAGVEPDDAVVREYSESIAAGTLEE